MSRGAGTRGYANVDAIRRVQGSGPPSDPVSRLTQEVRDEGVRRRLGLRRLPPASQRAAECKTRIRERAGVSEAELTKIEAEGVERNWPPLPPILMSLDPITEAGRLLCPS